MNVKEISTEQVKDYIRQERALGRQMEEIVKELLENRDHVMLVPAALTHGHPTALAASDLTAKTIADLIAGGSPLGLVARLRDYAQSQREVYHASWLGSLWEQFSARTPEAFIARGWDECIEVFGRVDAALIASDRDADPCLATGEGWVAEEAFAAGLLCFLLFPHEPVQALRRAAVTEGELRFNCLPVWCLCWSLSRHKCLVS